MKPINHIKSVIGKKPTLNRTRLFIVLFFCLLIPNISFAQPQCSFQLTNSMDCTTVLKVDWYDNCPSTPGTPCYSQNYTIGANLGTTATCNGCGTLCNVVVTVISIGTGGTSGAGIVDSGVWYSTSENGTLTGACGTNTTYNMQYNPTVFNINP